MIRLFLNATAVDARGNEQPCRVELNVSRTARSGRTVTALFNSGFVQFEQLDNFDAFAGLGLPDGEVQP